MSLQFLLNELRKIEQQLDYGQYDAALKIARRAISAMEPTEEPDECEGDESDCEDCECGEDTCVCEQ